METNKPTPLVQALKDAMLEEFADVPCEDEIDISVSERFQKNTKRLCKYSSYVAVRNLRTAIKRAALAAAIVTVLATTAMAIPDVRESFIRFFVSSNGTHYEFSFDPDQAATAPKTIETVYHASYIPEGYTLITSNIHPSGVSYYWQNKEKSNYIMFDQTVIGGVDKVPNSGDANATTININGYQVFRIRNESTVYCWTDNQYFFSLYFGPDINEANIIDIFTGIKPLNGNAADH